MSSTRTRVRFIAGVIVCVMAVATLFLFRSIAMADPVSEARAALNNAEAQVQELAKEHESLVSEIEGLQKRIDETSAAAMEAQEAILEGRTRLAAMVKYDYRSGVAVSILMMILESDNLEQLISSVEFAQEFMDYYADETRIQVDRKAELDAISKHLDDQKRAQLKALEELEEMQIRVEVLVSEASSYLSDVEEAARLEALQQIANQIGQTPGNKGEDVEIDKDANTINRGDVVQGGTVVGGSDLVDTSSGWLSGIASAYGGESDPYTPNPGTTATGAICDDSSMGVALPMSMPGYRSYFGRTIEIRYNGMTIYATVNDCGYMDGGSRVLDLQPGVFKAFGFQSCNEWGLRTVSYRFL